MAPTDPPADSSRPTNAPAAPGTAPSGDTNQPTAASGLPSVGQLCALLDDAAPLSLAESWDNVGLLLGRRSANVARLMTCLTIDDDVAEEAIQRRVGMILTHHPLPFKPLAKITSDSPTGALILKLLANQIAVYSAHTAFDSAAAGINRRWADGLRCQAITPLRPLPAPPSPASLTAPASASASAPPASNGANATATAAHTELVGAGRAGQLPQPLSLADLAEQVGRFAGVGEVRVVASDDRPIRRVAFACGSGGSFLSAAHAARCQAMVSGEASFHHCLEARARGINLLLVGHYHSERFAMEQWAADLQRSLAARWPNCQVFASERESNPLQTITL